MICQVKSLGLGEFLVPVVGLRRRNIPDRAGGRPARSAPKPRFQSLVCLEEEGR